MIYKREEIISMNELEFANHFKKSDNVSITLNKDNSIVKGLIEEIILATNMNSQTRDRLPTSIKVAGKNINILFDVETIEVM